MKVVYIAGPFRAPNAWEREQNIRHAERLALHCWAMGFAVICPHTNTRFFDGVLPDRVWLEGDLELLRRCDVVYALPDWKRSTGTTKEIEEAERVGIPWTNDLDVLRTILQEPEDPPR